MVKVMKELFLSFECLDFRRPKNCSFRDSVLLNDTHKKKKCCSLFTNTTAAPPTEFKTESGKMVILVMKLNKKIIMQ